MVVRQSSALLLIVMAGANVACGSSESDAASGGTASSGNGGLSSGGTSSGGSSVTSGGSAATGGAKSSGGVSSSTGGAPASGGASSAGQTGLPPIDPTKNLLDLTPEEKGLLCDWSQELLGGYGKVSQCEGGGTAQNFADKATCVAAGFRYLCMLVTVGDVESCTQAQVPSHGCDKPMAGCHAIYCM